MPQSITIVPLLESTPAPDAYARLLAESRGLRRPQQVERAAWVSTLSSDRRELLFELETLLKATACFANSRNHPGRPRRVPIVAQDFRLPLAILSKGFRRIVQLARQCLGSTDRYFEFHRYLEKIGRAHV